MRYERKYRIPQSEYAKVRALVLSHPLSFRKHYPDRQVNNIYLDTPDLECFQDNLIGASQRAKYRIRWYGAMSQEVQAPVLELKSKDGELGEKFSRKMADFSLGNLTDLEATLARQFREWSQEEGPRKANPIDALIQAAHFRPVLLNAYQRSYFISMDRKFRLTIDRDLRFQAIHGNFRGPGRMEKDPAVIIEIKYDREDDGRFDEVGQYFPLRPGKNSKYVTGMLMVGQV